MWHWLQNLQRKKLLETPFPPEWEPFINRNVPHARRLNAGDLKHLHDLTQVFVAEKRWEGCGGLTLTDEMRVTIAAQACLLILALPHDLYRELDSILIYPSTVVLPERKASFFEVPRALSTGPIPIEGEAQRHGTVILSWDAVLKSARHPERGHNLVYHELAHQLDMVGGPADGTPPLDTADQYQRWAEVFSREFLKLRDQVEAGTQTFLNAYAATNEAEFFAVVTEQFFDQPAAMKRTHLELYGLLREFYRQDPAELERAA